MWEVITYGGGDYLIEVFKAVQLFFGGPFQSLAQVAGMFGLIAVLMAYLGPRRNLDFTYILRFAVFYGALFVPKADVAIVDRIENPIQQVVADVPLGLAVLASMTSQIGDKLTMLYESYVTLPNDQQYHANGMVFGSTLLKSVPQVHFVDATFAGDMQEFIAHCAFASLANGVITIEQLEKDGDIWPLLSGNVPNNRFVYQSWNPGGAVPCEDAANAAGVSLSARMPAKVDEAQNFLGKLLWPKKTVVQASLDLSATLPLTANDIAGVNRSASEILRQAMMINAIGTALDKLPPDEAAGAMASIQAKTSAERSRFETYMTMGAVASRSVPIMRAVLEALAYALFPIVALMILLPMGLMAFLNYFIVLFWLQMWPVIYAVLNSIVAWYSMAANQAGTVMPNGLTDWTMWTTPAIVSTNSEIVALAGYLALSVPMIAYMLVRGGAMIGSQVASSLTQPSQTAAAQSGRELAYGNFQTGNVSVDTLSAHNQTMWQNRTGYSSSTGVNIDQSSSLRMGHTNTDGPFQQLTTADGGITAHRKQESDYGVAPKITEQLIGTMRTEAGKQWVAAYDQGNRHADVSSDALMRSLGINWSKVRTSDTSSGTGFERGAEVGRIGANVRDSMDRWERDSGFSLEDKARIFGGIHGELPVSALLGGVLGAAKSAFRAGKFSDAKESDLQNWEKSLTTEVDNWKKQKAGDPDALNGKKGNPVTDFADMLNKLAKLRGGAEGSIHAGMAQALKSAEAYSEQHNMRDQFSQYERAARDVFKHADQTSLRATGAQEVKDIFQRAHESRQEFAASLRSAEQFNEAAGRIETGGASFDVNLMPRFDRFLEDKGISDPARFAYASIKSNDGVMEGYVREFVAREAEGIVQRVTRNAPVNEGDDRAGAAKAAYSNHVDNAEGEGGRLQKMADGRNRIVKRDIDDHKLNPLDAVGTPGTNLGKAEIRRMGTGTGVKAAHGIAKVDELANQQEQDVRPKVEGRVPPEGGGSDVWGVTKEAVKHGFRGSTPPSPQPEPEGPPTQPASFRKDSQRPSNDQPVVGSGATEQPPVRNEDKQPQDGIVGATMRSILDALGKTKDQLTDKK